MFENRRTIVKLFLDAGSIVVAVFFAFIARYEEIEISTDMLREVVYYTGIYYAISIAFKNIQISWSYTDSYDVFKLITIHIITLILTIFFYSILREDYSRQVLALTFIFSLVIQLSMRMFFRMNRQYKYGFLKPKHENGKRALIYISKEIIN